MKNSIVNERSTHDDSRSQEEEDLSIDGPIDGPIDRLSKGWANFDGG